MERNIITINENGIAHIPDGEIWMSELELIELFHTIIPTLRAAVRAIYKSGVCDVGTDQRRYVLTHGHWIVCHDLPMVVALAFRINTVHAQIVRKALLERMENQRKEKTGIFFSLKMDVVKPDSLN